MKIFMRNSALAFATLFLINNINAQNRKIINSITNSDPVFPSIAANTPNPVFNVNDVSFLNADSAVAVGNNGMAWMSTDGGSNWNAISTFTSTADNNSVYWEDNYICVAGDNGTVTFSMDYGLTWQNASQALSTINYHGVDFANITFGVAVGDAGDAVIYKWASSFHWVHSPTGLNKKLNAVAAYKAGLSPFADGNVIAVGDNGSVVTYANGNWTISPNSISTNLRGVHLFSDNTTVLAVGDSGLIMRSPDFGNTWNILNYGTAENLNDISEGATPNQIIAVGDSGVIYVSSDTGYTFTRYTIGFTNTNLRGVSAKNPRGSFGGSGSTLHIFTVDTAQVTYVSRTSFCPGDNFKTAINLKGLYGINNLVSLQLSDSSGSFTSPVNIGSKLNPLLPNDSITGTIPSNTKASLLYKIRISSSDPQIISDPSPAALTIYPEPNNTSVQVVTTNLFVNFQAGCTYQWYYNSVILTGQTDSIVASVGNGNYYVIVTNSNGCSISSNVFNYNTALVSNAINNSQIVVSPNPASASLFVRVPDNFANRTINIYNALGNKVFSADAKPGINNCSISELESGIYFMVLDSFIKRIAVVR